MEKPVVFLAFADSKGGGSEAARGLGELNELGPEFDGIYTALRDLPTVEVEFAQNVRAEELIARVGKSRDRIVIFHYAGHSHDGMMVIGGGGSADSLARTLKDCPNLRLVFLNGCGTVSMTNTLLEAGIPAVIATSGPIGDPKARQFAIDFYRALGQYRQSAKGKPSRLRGHNSVEAALEEANKQLTGDKSRAVGVVTYTRGVAGPDGPAIADVDGATPVSEWDLHVEDRRQKSWENALPWNWRVFEKPAQNWSVPVRLPTAALPLLGVLVVLVLLFQPLWFPTISSALFPLFLTLGGLIVGWRLPLLNAQKFTRASCVAAAVFVVLAGFWTWLYLPTPMLRLVFVDNDAISVLQNSDLVPVTVTFDGGELRLDAHGGVDDDGDAAATVVAGSIWLANVSRHSIGSTLESFDNGLDALPSQGDTPGVEFQRHFRSNLSQMQKSQTAWTGPFDLSGVTSISAALDGLSETRQCSTAGQTLTTASVGRWPFKGEVTTCLLWKSA